MQVHVCFTPGEYPGCGERHIAVVIDVFRATSSMAAAMFHGCKMICPVRTVEEALQLRQNEYPAALLAGERKGLLIPGFDLGNSPLEYTAAVVDGREIIMTTTNGTQALNHVSQAATVYTAAFVNAAAVCERLRNAATDVMVLCSGTEGRFALEDALCAGLIAGRLAENAVLSDTAVAALAMYRDFCCSGNMIPRVAASSHASYLRQIGYSQDVAYCLQHDIYPVVPVFTQGKVTL
ncbi:2-phosphosulpholactate phosphatase [Lucifera butyrica]|uniref:Probable 2-phosphosulfolactate phosphatase n=1 Tax=Lucifera butyrica TaxID=1351585 RepID=A0A498R5C1_9FIRM|nr:2-phosphosulfolactate phosphatase [Lucifera butyrica]VBB06305.1 2-phosphosulpholactate phosphatase [Lucifera butyrica]